MNFLFRPSARIERDGAALSAAEAGMVRAEIACGLGEIGEATLTIWPRSRLANLAPGARLAIALGPAGQEALVFTGQVAQVARTAAAVILWAREPTAALETRFASRAYLNQSAAAIARDLTATVETETIEADLALAQYAVENRRDAWWHLRDLAGLAGCDLTAAPDGKCILRPAGRGGTHTLRHGAEVLSFETGERLADPHMAVAAHGGASGAGPDRWHWIAPDPLGAYPEPTRILTPLATDDAATAAGKADAARGQARAKFGRVQLLGDAGIRPGDGIDLREAAVAGVPAEPLWRATHVRHCFDTAGGFVTDVDLEGGSAGANPLAGLS